MEGARALRALPAPRGPPVLLDLRAIRATRVMPARLAPLAPLDPRGLRDP